MRNKRWSGANWQSGEETTTEIDRPIDWRRNSKQIGGNGVGGVGSVPAARNHSRHALRHGQRSPKHIGNDVWDVAMERRDKKLMEILSSSSTATSSD
ncbi:OLC1v1033502C1 [Oldenlandia corymbosa var. corymbosa]|uniref:OLC1v1033502C1 n=1 Tax=Oldenlandia corymbosa var. corymbosa TaxID=529605 RepID=A0AAV1CNH8_OLDCO|nr:OLC1v1033502C1 [Oldenlandia corymbosa var. corymbosa]